MTTAVKTRPGPLHSALVEAQGSLNGTQVLIAQFKEELEQLRATDQDLSARIHEALIAEEMGTAPADDVASLRRERLELADAIERQEARVTAFQRRLEEQDSAQCMAASDLRVATVSWVETTAKEIRERTDQAALELQRAQQQAIALVRLLGQLNIKGVLDRDLNLSHILTAEIMSSSGVKWGVWPAMGDRKTGNDLIAGQMEALRAELGAL